MRATTKARGGKWKPGILSRLRSGRLRLLEMRRQVPWTSERGLIRRIGGLVEAGLVTRVGHGTRPLHTDYGLSAHDEILRPLLAEMGCWGRCTLRGRGSRSGMRDETGIDAAPTPPRADQGQRPDRPAGPPP